VFIPVANNGNIEVNNGFISLCNTKSSVSFEDFQNAAFSHRYPENYSIRERSWLPLGSA